MATFNFITYPNLNVHELIISDSVNRFIISDSIPNDTIILPYFPPCFESSCMVWNLPFPCSLTKLNFNKLDSILYYKTSYVIHEFDSTLKNKDNLQIRYCDGTENGYYDRYIEFSSDFYKIFEFAYLLEKLDPNKGNGCNYWIFDYLEMSQCVFNPPVFEEEYQSWKKENKKE